MKKMNFKKYGLISISIIIFSVLIEGCKHDTQPVFSNIPVISYNCNSDTVYFQNDILPLLNSTCATTGCHDAQTGKHGVVLTDYNSVMQTGGINVSMASESKIYKAIEKTGDENMPPAPAKAWTNSQKDMLYAWITQGALNNQCNGDSSSCDTSAVSFKKDVLPLFQTYCLGCHDANNASGGINLNNFDDLAVIIDNGRLLGSINFEPGYSSMPKNGDKLNFCDRRKIAIWANDTTLTPPGGGGNNGGISCDPDTTYFQNTVLPLIVSNCATTGCHDNTTHQEGIRLTDYSSIMQYGRVKPGNPDGSKLYKVLFGGGDDGDGGREDDIMPPPPKPPFNAEQKNIVRNWILQGAKNNYCDGNCDTTNVTFSETIWPVIQTYCLACHSGSGAGGGVVLSNYAEVTASANSGKLIGSIRHDQGYSPMPKGGQKLSDCIIREFEIWIENGTPEN